MSGDWVQVGKELKYARPERERRFLFSGPPTKGVVRSARIADRYLLGTRLRLRRMTEDFGGGGSEQSVHKLTQKVPGPSGQPGLITTIYLNPAEYAVLQGLPAASLWKTRLSVPPLGIDVFDGVLAGLVLGEAEFSDEQSLANFIPPLTPVAEVTSDERLTGGRLAVTSKVELYAVLADYGLHQRGQ